MVQKNNIKLPSINELTQPQRVNKTTLESYLKNKPHGKQEEENKHDTVKKEQKQKKAHFKIDDAADNAGGVEHQENDDGEEFNDSDDEHN